MAVHNKEIADILTRVADLLEIDGENAFRVRSYRQASRTIAEHPESLEKLYRDGKDLTALPDIGESIAEKIAEIVKTGKLDQLEKIEKRVPGGLADLLGIEQLGPQRVKSLYNELDIRNTKDLKKAAENGEISKIKGFGKKTEESILEEIGKAEEGIAGRRFKWAEAEELIQSLLEYLEKNDHISTLLPAGSFRRSKETVGDIDILAIGDDPESIMKSFTSFDEVKKIVSKGKTRSTVILRSGLQVDLRLVEEESYGAAMHYFTGSKDHNVAVRKIAQSKGYKLNEYGVFEGDRRRGGSTEEEVFEMMGLRWIEPELRENRGEIDAARKGKLPQLITLEDIRGDLQSHTDNTDGKYSLKEMVNAAKGKGYDYCAVTDHSKRVTMAKGLDEKRLRGLMEKIDALNESMKGFRILKGIEVDILEDGSLDLSDDVLSQLDVVVFSVHYNRNLSEKKQTERIIRAMDNRYVNIFAHPTGRLIGEREPYAVDLEKVMKAALERGVFLEVNAHPDRLDLSDIHIKRAKELGLKVAISTDAHSTGNLFNMRHGVAQARRGWLEADDVINTRTWRDLKKLLKRS